MSVNEVGLGFVKPVVYIDLIFIDPIITAPLLGNVINSSVQISTMKT